MEARRFVPGVGIVAAAVVVLLLALPYGVVGEPGGIATYYGAGAINPLIAGVFSLAAIIVFAAAREERSDPALAAGAALVLGLFGFVVVALWAASVPRGVATQFETSALFAYHRIVTVAAAFVLPVAAAWYARAIGVV